MISSLTVPARFQGPPRSGNGGWTAGSLAHHLAQPLAPGPVQVTLRTPPPLDVPLRVEVDGGPGGQTARALHGDVLVAEAEAAASDLAPVPGVDAAVAQAAEQTYAGHRSHPFPSCFACGTDRDDGLRIFPGRVDDADGRVRVAATWTPDASVGDDADDVVATLAVTWAALDCVGGWAGDLEERLMVLGRMTAHVRDLPRIGETHVVVGTALGTDGRRTRTAATLRTASGQVLGTAEHVWFAVDPEDFS